MRTIKRPIVSAIIFSKDKKMLMGMKDPQKEGVYSDCWHIPGGGIEENETKMDALIREVKEEVGIDVKDSQIELVSDDGKGTAEKILKGSGEKVLVEMHFYVYKVVLTKNTENVRVVLNDDLTRYQWFDLSELPSVKLTPPSITLFKKLGYL